MSFIWDVIKELICRNVEQNPVIPTAPEDLNTLIDQNRLIEAIKLVRDQRRCDLKEAKEIVERMRDERRGKHF